MWVPKPSRVGALTRGAALRFSTKEGRRSGGLLCSLVQASARGPSLKYWRLEDPQEEQSFLTDPRASQAKGSWFAPLDYFFTMSAITLLVGSTITRSWSTIA
jgi:hypothetical protein